MVLYCRFPDAARDVGFPAMRSSIYRYRKYAVPPVPHSLVEFAATLRSPLWAQYIELLNDPERRPFFRQLIGGEAVGWMAAVFLSERLGNALDGTQRIHMDATFKTMPQDLHAYQLLTIHAEHMNFVSRPTNGNRYPYL